MDKKTVSPKLSMSSTKQEVLDAYNALLKQVQEKSEAELRPEKKIEEKRGKEAVEKADSLSSEGVVKATNDLKLEIGKMLGDLSEKMETEVKRFKDIQKAIEVKQGELQELYEIEKSAATLAALIGAQSQKRQEFELEMAGRKEELNEEIETTRADWKKERTEYEAQVKARDTEEKKRREREREEFIYGFQREQQITKDRFEDEKSTLEKEIGIRKEQVEKDLTEREKVVHAKEEELEQLRKQASSFSQELDRAVNKAAKDATDRITLETNSQMALLNKEYEGERKVFITRIESLEQTVKEQSEQIAKLSQQLEKAYQKVQDIAVKAVEGSANVSSLSSLQHLVREHTRTQSQEK